MTAPALGVSILEQLDWQPRHACDVLWNDDIEPCGKPAKFSADVHCATHWQHKYLCPPCLERCQRLSRCDTCGILHDPSSRIRNVVAL